MICMMWAVLAAGLPIKKSPLISFGKYNLSQQTRRRRFADNFRQMCRQTFQPWSMSLKKKLVNTLIYLSRRSQFWRCCTLIGRGEIMLEGRFLCLFVKLRNSETFTSRVEQTSNGWGAWILTAAFDFVSPYPTWIYEIALKRAHSIPWDEC